MIELKPCPFCGSDNVDLREGVAIGGAVHCYNCGADVVFLTEKDEDDSWRQVATEKWNTRKESV